MAVAVAVPLVLLYAAGINPYFVPSVYDNVVYYHTAKSLAFGEGYQLAGSAVLDWPPAFAMVLSVPFALGLESVVAAKAVVLVCTALGVYLAYRLLRLEDRTTVGVAVLALVVLPTSWRMATRVGAEWPYLAASLACLCCLHALGEKRSMGLAFAAGALLGVAALTRYAGVFLGAAFIAQAVAKAREPGEGSWLGRARPEILASATGGCMFVAWAIVAATLLPQSGEQACAENLDPNIYRDFHPLAVLGAVGNLLCHSHDVVSRVGLPRLLAVSLCLVPAALCAVGLVALRRSRRPSDWYVLAYLCFLCFYERGDVQVLTRYLLPVAPFLITYLFAGVRFLARLVSAKWTTAGEWLPRVALAGWLAAAMACNVSMLFRGNFAKTYRGPCALISRSPESFYLGYWKALYLACQEVRKDPGKGSVAMVGTRDWQYIMHFSGRRPVPIAEIDKARFVIEKPYGPLPPGLKAASRLTSVGRWGDVTLYERRPERS